VGKTGLCWNVTLISWFGMAAESNRRAAFQNESIFVARWRPSKGRSITGSMIGSRFISSPPRAHMRPSWHDRHLVYPTSGRAFSPRPGKGKYNLSYVAIGNRALKLNFKRKEK